MKTEKQDKNREEEEKIAEEIFQKERLFSA